MVGTVAWRCTVRLTQPGLGCAVGEAVPREHHSDGEAIVGGLRRGFHLHLTI